MTLDNEEIHYKVWASDNVVYGPVLLVTLCSSGLPTVV